MLADDSKWEGILADGYYRKLRPNGARIVVMGIESGKSFQKMGGSARR